MSAGRRRAALLAAAALAAGGPTAWAAPPHWVPAARGPLTLTLTGHLTVAGAAATAGAEVGVFDPRGTLCGAAGADPAHGGAFVLHVYGDDPTTPTADGARAGEALRLAVYAPTTGQTFEGAALRLSASALGDAPPSLPPTFVDRAAWTLEVEVLGAADADGDGVADAADAFPTDPAASVDTDADGTPDAWNPGRTAADSTTDLTLDAFPTDPAAALDADGDGHPDAWNPGKTAADSTTGLSLDDYPGDPVRWFDPARHRPARPEIAALAPDPAAPLTRFAAELSPFADPDGDALAAVEWQVFALDPATNAVLGNAFRAELPASAPPSELRLPAAALAARATYGFVVRYRDATGLWSEVSPEAVAATPADPLDRSGQPGIQDAAEVPQKLPGVLQFKDPATSAALGLVAPAGATVSRLFVTDAAGLPPESRPAGELPYGLYSFCLEGVSVGARVEVTFLFPQPLPVDSRWVKLGGDGVPLDFTAHRALTADGRSATLTLEDGGLGDADGLANGAIVDPSGPVLASEPLPPEPGGGGGGGGGRCFLSAPGADAPRRITGGALTLGSLAGLLALLGRDRRPGRPRGGAKP